ncbi:arp2, partial [Symbiodinium sp. KB8]
MWRLDDDSQSLVVGDRAAELRKALEISYPLENGIVKNWDDMEHVWNYMFAEKLKADPSGQRILLTEAPMNPKANREKMMEIMFEKYNFSSAQVFLQAILSLYAEGLGSGIVVDSGDGVTHVIAVDEGYYIPHLTQRLDVAGRHITRYLIKLMLLRGYAFNRSADFQTVQDIKEKFCY